MPPGPLGIVANPASGKDVRRLVARASVFDNQEKQAIVRRVLSGFMAAGGQELVYFNDPHGMTRAAIDDAEPGLRAEALEATETGTALDTISSARIMAERHCSTVVTLGGDGTNRAFAMGWQTAPLIPISTGTNNVFPELVEATVAGAAAGLIASGRIARADVSRQVKAIRVAIDGERPDLALIDVVLSRERFVGARALLAPEQLAMALLTRADPAAVGITAIGGLLEPMDDREDAGLLLQFGAGGERVYAPIAPGYYREVPVRSRRPVNFVEEIEVVGPGVLAFDGERERVLRDGQKAWLQVARSGPWVVDVAATLSAAAAKGAFSR
jgi:predicted polyphosphate/ATP-dependent NAD kinase